MRLGLYDVDSLLSQGIGIAIVVIVAGLLVSIGLFLLVRLIVLWYFKINKMLKELTKMNYYLERLVAQGEVPHVTVQQAAPQPIVQPLDLAPQPVAQPMNPAPQPIVQPLDLAPQPIVQPLDPTPQPMVQPLDPTPQPMIQPMPQETAAIPAMAAPIAAEPVKRTCVKCGAVLQDGASFCMQCGTKN